MHDRRARLVRIVRMYDTLQTATEARCAALANEDAALERRVLDLVAALGAGACGDALQRAASMRLTAISRERFAIAARLADEKERRLAADRRVRTAERALERLLKEIADNNQRRDLEEIRLVPAWSPASRKPEEGKV